MPKINNLGNLTVEQINEEVQNGARFVIFYYCFSLIIMTFKRPSDIYYIKKTDSGWQKGMTYTIISFLFGWWGIPWGPIYTIGSLYNNLTGGKDVTNDVLLRLFTMQTKVANTEQPPVQNIENIPE